MTFGYDRGNRGTKEIIAVSSFSKNTTSAFSLLTTCTVLKQTLINILVTF